MSTTAFLQEFSRLGHAQQLQLLADLWDSVAETNPPPLSAAQKKELARRKKRYLEGKSNGRPWSEVKARLLKSDER
ncbi:MAG: addiction module protein [Verrucomicrobiaceae bacterium]